jgi:hypothetical protein
MSFEKIISIPGKSGLYKMLAQLRNGGFVVEALSDSRRVPVSATERIIMLSDISVYTTEEDIPLREVFLKMKENEKVATSVDAKSDPDKLKATLKQILPDFDDERVHSSDIRKMFVWFNLLKDKVEFTAPAEEAAAEEAVVEATSEEKASAKKTARKKKEATAEETEEAPAAEKKPRAKKTAAKKD